MAKNLFNNHYRTDTARAQWNDYNDGAYFITICTANREPYFGSIIDKEMVFTDIGRYSHECIGKIEALHSGIQVPIFQVMPDHVHIIVHVFNQSFIDSGCDVLNIVENTSQQPPHAFVDQPLYGQRALGVEPPYHDGSTPNGLPQPIRSIRPTVCRNPIVNDPSRNCTPTIPSSHPTPKSNTSPHHFAFIILHLH